MKTPAIIFTDDGWSPTAAAIGFRRLTCLVDRLRHEPKQLIARVRSRSSNRRIVAEAGPAAVGRGGGV